MEYFDQRLDYSTPSQKISSKYEVESGRNLAIVQLETNNTTGHCPTLVPTKSDSGVCFVYDC